jgi:hypothetical protein
MPAVASTAFRSILRGSHHRWRSGSKDRKGQTRDRTVSVAAARIRPRASARDTLFTGLRPSAITISIYMLPPAWTTTAYFAEWHPSARQAGVGPYWNLTEGMQRARGPPDPKPGRRTVAHPAIPRVRCTAVLRPGVLLPKETGVGPTHSVRPTAEPRRAGNRTVTPSPVPRFYLSPDTRF